MKLMIKLIRKYFRETENFTVAVIGSRGMDSQSLVRVQLYIIAGALMIPSKYRKIWPIWTCSSIQVVLDKLVFSITSPLDKNRSECSE